MKLYRGKDLPGWVRLRPRVPPVKHYPPTFLEHMIDATIAASANRIVNSIRSAQFTKMSKDTKKWPKI